MEFAPDNGPQQRQPRNSVTGGQFAPSRLQRPSFASGPIQQQPSGMLADRAPRISRISRISGGMGGPRESRNSQAMLASRFGRKSVTGKNVIERAWNNIRGAVYSPLGIQRFIQKIQEDKEEPKSPKM
eukprot:2135026-Pyramimonas_sp.AAC.1